jgi:hypothetical protein
LMYAFPIQIGDRAFASECSRACADGIAPRGGRTPDRVRFAKADSVRHRSFRVRQCWPGQTELE